MIRPSLRFNQVKRAFEPFKDREGYYRLDRNEDPVGCDITIFNEWKNQLTVHDIAAYADSTQLIQKLSRWLQVSPDNLHITAGSDALIKTIFETYIDQGDLILLQNPSWRMYEVYASIYGAKMHHISYDEDLNFDIDSLTEALTSNEIRLLVLANPNQPTGTNIDFESLKHIIKLAQGRGTIVVVDEAYHLFSDISSASLVNDYDNLIIARTFSKAFGMAGLRIGYAVTHPDRIQDLMLLRPVTDSNSLALNFASYLLDRIDYVMQKVENFNEGREYLFEKMRERTILCHRSYGNFLLVACPSADAAREIINQASEKKYLIKGPFSEFPLKNYVRITTGPLSLMESFWDDCAPLFEKFGKKFRLES